MPTALLERPSWAPPGDLDDVEPYVNDECPDRCTEDHDVDEHFQCPATLNWWGWCEDHNSYVPDTSWDSGRHPSHGRICETHSWDYSECETCGDLTHENEGRYVERRDAFYCNDCAPGDANNCGQGSPGLAREQCPTCQTYNDHFDELSEEFLCLHVATERIEQGSPILLMEAA